jgi:hypothetical protein
MIALPAARNPRRSRRGGGQPGCQLPVAPAPEGAGRPSRYCQNPAHNAQSAFRERRRRAAAGEVDEAAEAGGGVR